MFLRMVLVSLNHNDIGISIVTLSTDQNVKNDHTIMIMNVQIPIIAIGTVLFFSISFVLFFNLLPYIRKSSPRHGMQ